MLFRLYKSSTLCHYDSSISYLTMNFCQIIDEDGFDKCQELAGLPHAVLRGDEQFQHRKLLTFEEL